MTSHMAIDDAVLDSMIDQLRTMIAAYPRTAVVMVAVRCEPSGPDNLQKVTVQRAVVNANSFDLMVAASDIIDKSIEFLTFEMSDQPDVITEGPAVMSRLKNARDIIDLDRKSGRA